VNYASTWAGNRSGVFEDRGPLRRCPVCGLLYVHDSPADRRLHRTRHRSVLDVYEPKADAQLTALYHVHGAHIPLDAAPRRLCNRLARMASMFRREFGYDFAPFHAAEKNDARSRHWLIVTPDGRPIGGFSARQDTPAQWAWTWVWVIPAERRQGHTRRVWQTLTAAVPAIEPDPPFSPPIARFFRDRDSSRPAD
jgi:hypothetical protein